MRRSRGLALPQASGRTHISYSATALWRASCSLVHTVDFPSVRVLTLVAAVLLAVTLPAAGQQAEAQPTQRLIAQICRPHAEVEAKLLSDFGERKLGHGISGDGTLVELFAGPSGTFTVVKTSPRGVACIVDFGESWQTLRLLEAAGLLQDGVETGRPF